MRVGNEAGAPGRALVLACGNTLRGDDGIGWRIGYELRREQPMAGVTIVLTHQLLPEHAEAVSAAEIVIFVDCSVAIPPGSVSTVIIHPAQNFPSSFTHNLYPASLLRLALDLYGRLPSRSVAVIVGGESFELENGLSMSGERALPQALDEVHAQLGLDSV